MCTHRKSERDGQGADDDERGAAAEFGGDVVVARDFHGGGGGGGRLEEEPGAAEGGDGRADGQEMVAENGQVVGPDEVGGERAGVLALEVVEEQAAEGEGVGAEREAAQEAAVELAGEPEHHEALERPAEGDPFLRDGEGRRQDDEEGGEGDEGQEEAAVLAVRGEEAVDEHDVEGGEGEGEHGDGAGGVGGGDDAVAEDEEGRAVGHGAEDFEEGGLDAADEVVEEHRGGEEQEEAGEEGHHDGEIGGDVVLGDGQGGEAVGEQHGEIVEQRPVPAARDAEDADAEQEQIAEEAGEVLLAGAQQDGRGVAAEDAEDGDEQRIEARGEKARAEGDEGHEAEGGQGADEMVEGIGGEGAEVEDREAAAEQALAEQVVRLAEQARADGEHGDAGEGAEHDARMRADEAVVDGVLQEEADADDEDDDGEAQEPGGGDGEFPRDALGLEFLVDDDPVPDAAQRAQGLFLERGRLGRRAVRLGVEPRAPAAERGPARSGRRGAAGERRAYDAGAGAEAVQTGAGARTGSGAGAAGFLFGGGEAVQAQQDAIQEGVLLVLAVADLVQHDQGPDGEDEEDEDRQAEPEALPWVSP